MSPVFDETDLTMTQRPIPLLENGFAIFDAEDRMVAANPEMLELPETEIANLLGASGHEILTGMLERFVEIRGFPSTSPEYISNALTAWRAPSAAIQARSVDGKWRMLSNCPRPDGGRCYLAIGTTSLAEGFRSHEADRNRIEERAVNLFRGAMESLNEGVGLYDDDDRLVFFNRTFKALLDPDGDVMEVGWDLKKLTPELIRRGVFVLPDGMSEDSLSDHLINAIRTSAKDVEVPMSDGRILMCASHETPLSGHLITIEDITERGRAEQAGREADMLVRKIVEASPTTFLVSRVADGKIIYFPEASHDRFGDIETTLSFFLKPEDREDYLAALLPTGVLDDYPVRFRRHDGSIMSGLTSARVTDYKGEDVIVSSTRDITEQLAMQAELERQREAAHQNEKLSALGELLAGVAHELNNPLSIVVGYALMLQDKVEEPRLKRKVERIGQAAERCAKIVKTFLAMARQRPTRIEQCSMNEAIETALDIAGYGLRTGGAQVVLELDQALPFIDADPDQMAQVFTNLIVNAEHALTVRGEKGRLTLRSFHDQTAGEVVAEVCDNGDGVTKDILARIFEPFFTTKDVGSGTGVGLAFCHRIVDSHGGTLSVNSTPGNGASFTVRMKATMAAAEAATARPEPPTPYTGQRILVVDDEAGVTDLIRDLLEEEGYEVDTRNEARAALALLKTQRFDAILSDIKMPGLDGEAFLAEIRTLSPRHATRVAFVTGDTMSPRVADFLKDTGQPYLEKPIAPADLIRLVERLCAKTQESKE